LVQAVAVQHGFVGVKAMFKSVLVAWRRTSGTRELILRLIRLQTMPPKLN